MPQATSAVIDGKPLQFHYFTGKVMSSQKSKETQVTSHQGGTQGNPTTHVSSYTIDHHELFLSDASGTERAFKMQNFDFPCREGHTLTVMWAIPEGSEQGPFVAVRNHNTGELHKPDQKLLQWLFAKPLWMRAGAIVGALIIGFIINPLVGLFLWVAPVLYFAFKKKNAAVALLGSDALKQMDSQVASLKPMPA